MSEYFILKSSGQDDDAEKGLTSDNHEDGGLLDADNYSLHGDDRLLVLKTSDEENDPMLGLTDDGSDKGGLITEDDFGFTIVDSGEVVNSTTDTDSGTGYIVSTFTATHSTAGATSIDGSSDTNSNIKGALEVANSSPTRTDEYTITESLGQINPSHTSPIYNDSFTVTGVTSAITSIDSAPLTSPSEALSVAESISTEVESKSIDSSTDADTVAQALASSGSCTPVVSVGESIVGVMADIEISGITTLTGKTTVSMYSFIGPQNATAEPQIRSAPTTSHTSANIAGAAYTPLSPSMGIVTNVETIDSGVATFTSDSLTSAQTLSSATITLAKTVSQTETFDAILETSSLSDGAVATVLADTFSGSGTTKTALNALRTLSQTESFGESSTVSDILAAVTATSGGDLDADGFSTTSSVAEVPTAVYDALESVEDTASTSDLVATAVEAIEQEGVATTETEIAALASRAVSSHLRTVEHASSESEATAAAPTATDLAGRPFNTTEGSAHIESTSATGSRSDGVSTTEIGNFTLHFNGDDQYGAKEGVDMGSASNSFTLSHWVYFPSDITQDSYFVTASNTDSSGANTNYAGFKNDGDGHRMRFVVYDGSFNSPTFDIPKNEWVHVTGVFDYGEQRIYVNGELERTNNIDSDEVEIFDTFTIGGNPPDGDHYFEGGLNDIRWYDRALDSSEVENLTDGKHILEGLVSHWNIEEGYGNTVYDTGGIGNHLTLHNSPSWSGDAKYVNVTDQTSAPYTGSTPKAVSALSNTFSQTTDEFGYTGSDAAPTLADVLDSEGEPYTSSDVSALLNDVAADILTSDTLSESDAAVAKALLESATLGSYAETETEVESVIVPTIASPQSPDGDASTDVDAFGTLVDSLAAPGDSYTRSQSDGEIIGSGSSTKPGDGGATALSEALRELADGSPEAGDAFTEAIDSADVTEQQMVSIASAVNTQTSVTASMPMATSDGLGSALTSSVGVGAEVGETNFSPLYNYSFTSTGVGGGITGTSSTSITSMEETITTAFSLATLAETADITSPAEADAFVTALSTTGTTTPAVSVGESIVTAIGRVEISNVTAVGGSLSTEVYAHITPQDAESGVQIGSSFTTSNVSGDVTGASYTPISPSMSIVTNVSRTDSGTAPLLSDSLAATRSETSATVTLAKTVADSSTLAAMLETSSMSDGAIAAMIVGDLTSDGFSEVDLDAVRTLMDSDTVAESNTASQIVAALTDAESDTMDTTEHAATTADGDIPVTVYEALESVENTSSTADLVTTAVETIQNEGDVYSRTDVAAMSSRAVADYLEGKPYTETGAVGGETEFDGTTRTGLPETEVVIDAIHNFANTADITPTSNAKTIVEGVISEMESRDLEAPSHAAADVASMVVLTEAATERTSETASAHSFGDVGDGETQSLVSTLNTRAVSDATTTTLDVLASTGLLDTRTVSEAIHTVVEAVETEVEGESVTTVPSRKAAVATSTIGSKEHAASVALGMVAIGTVEPAMAVRLFQFATVSGGNSVELLSGDTLTRVLNGESVVGVVSDQFGRILDPHNDLEVTK